MKKITAMILSLVFCLTAALALASCSLQEMLENADYTEEYTADNKDGSVELINSFFEETLKDPNFVITNKNKAGEVQFTETVKGTSGLVVYKDGSETYAYKKGDFYYVAMISFNENEDGEVEEHRYYYCSDNSKPGYYKDNELGTMKDMYNGSYCTFMGKYLGINLVSALPEENATFSCVSKGEKKDGVTTGSLTFDYTTESGTIKITADSKENLVQTIRIVVTDNATSEANRDFTWTFEYGSASITLPDTDAWVIDPAGFGLANLRGRAICDEDATPKGFDGIRRTALGELTFEFKNVKQRCCRIKNLMTSANAIAAIRSYVPTVVATTNSDSPLAVQEVSA